MPAPSSEDSVNQQRLRDAEARALDLLSAIEREGLITPGQSERAIGEAIFALAARDFGVTTHWHPSVVRAGVNTLATAGQMTPERIIGEDDMVFVDLGPVFDTWEADVGQSYAIGPDPRKHALAAALPQQFATVRAHYLADPDITGAALYAFASASAEAAGWRFGGKIAGHVVGPFPHSRLPGPKQRNHISPENPEPLSGPDLNGDPRHWILEIHLIDPSGEFGGFYERLMLPA